MDAAAGTDPDSIMVTLRIRRFDPEASDTWSGRASVCFHR